MSVASILRFAQQTGFNLCRTRTDLGPCLNRLISWLVRLFNLLINLNRCAEKHIVFHFNVVFSNDLRRKAALTNQTVGNSQRAEEYIAFQSNQLSLQSMCGETHRSSCRETHCFSVYLETHFLLLSLLSMHNHTIECKTQNIRDTIKSIVVQLDHWETDQQEQVRHCNATSVNFPQGISQRQELAFYHARTSL